MSNNHYYADSESIRAYYNAILQQVMNLHNTIWEEIKHFSWLLSLLLSAPFVLLVSESGEKLFFQYGWITTVLASLIALIGAKIIYRESEHFSSFSYYLHRAEWALGLYQPHPTLQKLGSNAPQVAPKHRQEYFVETESCDEFVRRQNRFRLTSIRWLFIILFLLYAAIGMLLSTWILIHHILA